MQRKNRLMIAVLLAKLERGAHLHSTENPVAVGTASNREKLENPSLELESKAGGCVIR
jgi:hypothetical protein